jgi:hypothetical protein
VIVAVPDASFWISLGHLSNQRMLVDQNTLDQLVEIHHRELRIFGIIAVTEIFEVKRTLHFFFIKRFLAYNYILFILIHMFDVSSPSIILMFSDL